MPTIALNGENRPIRPHMTVAELLRELRIPATGIAVAVNDAIVVRGDHDAHELCSGDRVEIIHAIGGG